MLSDLQVDCFIFSLKHILLIQLMKHLHAYWRLDYIEAPKKSGLKTNPFLDIPKTKNDKSVHLLYRGKHTYIVLNIFPYNAGHLLAVPYNRVDSLEKLASEERADLMETVVKAQQILTKALSPDGFNIGLNVGSAAGAGIPEHLHVHIVPRWNGDTNFMPVIGDTKTLSQALDNMYDRLRLFVDA
jgi:ATP adenylyltransferase